MKIFSIILFTLFLLCCSSPTPSVKATSVVLIFCDLSSSIDKIAIEKVKRDLSTLMMKFPVKTKLYILPISESPIVSPIFEFTYPSIGSNVLERDKNKQEVRQAVQTATSEIEKLYKLRISDTASKDRPLSCILRTLETAHSYFSLYQNRDNKEFQFELIYLSDMLEECQNSPVGPIFLTKVGYNNALQHLEKYKPDFDLSYARVSIIVSIDSYGQNSLFISYEQLKEIWQLMFKKVGFTKDRFQEFGFLATIPPRLTDKNLWD